MIMKRTIILLWAAIGLLFFSFDAKAGNLPVYPQDPNIVTGVLPNGVSYYIAINRTCKGLADFALVQKVGYGQEDSLSRGKSVSIAKSSLSWLPKFNGRDPEKFLVTYGMSSRKGMLVDVREDATVYRFERLPLSHGDAAVDSTFLMIFDIIANESYRDDGFFKKWYGTSSQAIVVSGDVDKNAMVSKLKLLSLMVPERRSDGEKVPYKWEPKEEVSYSVTRNTSAKVSSITVTYISPRTPEEFMNTVLPSVSERLGDILGTVLRKRLYDEFRYNDIPVAEIGYRYVKSADMGGDERYEIKVTTEDVYVERAVAIIAEVCSYIDNNGIGVPEFNEAKNQYLIDVYAEAKQPLLSNRYNVDKCISSFLYGAEMAVPMERYNFFVSAKIPDSTQVRLFNNFTSELLDCTGNLSVQCVTSSGQVTEDRLMEAFETAWHKEAKSPYLRLYPEKGNAGVQVQAEKLKLTSDRKEPVSGGRRWTFSNGMKVVYMRMPTDGIFYYTMLVRGGYSEMKDIRRGEGAFLASVLGTYDIAGLRSDDFNCMNAAAGISMSYSVNASDIRIYGKAPRPELPLMMESLKSLANRRTVNLENYEYMRRCMDVGLAAGSGSFSDRMAAVDSLLCPSYLYSSYMSAGNMSDDLPERAEVFFESQFSKMNEGVLVIVGDMEETAMRRFLQASLSGFRTRPSTLGNVKPSYQPVSGESTYILEGERQSMDMVMSAPLTFTAENYMAARIAALAIRDAVAKSLCGTSTRFRVLYDTIVYPQERFNVVVSVSDADPDGCPEGSVRLSSLEMLYYVRSVMAELSGNLVSGSDLDVYKSVLKNELASRQADPQYIINIVSMRYSAGKDLNTKYAEKIESVTAGQVREILSSLDNGSKIEYVITE